jgi:hypothetical protein
MTTIDWRIKGKEFANCNCSYGCPCQFNALPTHGFCCAAVGFQIEEGRFGDVKLDGLRAVGIYRWPGPVHEGNGTMQLIVDKSADAKQRDALLKIMNGEETEEFATKWFVFSAMAPNKLEPAFETIDFEVDVDARRAKLVIPGSSSRSASRSRIRLRGASTACASIFHMASNIDSPRSAAAARQQAARSNSISRIPTVNSPAFT